MERIPEAELMNGMAQARAYASADFSEPHSMFMTLFGEYHPSVIVNKVLDLGCGPGDISCRFARAYPNCHVDAVDGAQAMLVQGRKLIRHHGLETRIALHHCYLPDDPLPANGYDTIISNSLLHHLAEPQTLWEGIRAVAAPASAVFIMDLLRPDSRRRAHDLVELYAAGEAAILRDDFFHSLLAAYTLNEVREQLTNAGLDGFTLAAVSDRHWCVSGVIPG